MRLDHFNNFVVLVTGILRDSDGRILFTKRSDKNKTFRGFWQLPEGKMEFGEQPAETLARELKEELGYQLLSSQLVAVNSAVISFQKKDYHLLRIVLEAKAKGTIILDTDNDACQWLNLEKAIKTLRLVDGTKKILLTLKGRE